MELHTSIGTRETPSAKSRLQAPTRKFYSCRFHRRPGASARLCLATRTRSAGSPRITAEATQGSRTGRSRTFLASQRKIKQRFWGAMPLGVSDESVSRMMLIQTAIHFSGASGNQYPCTPPSSGTAMSQTLLICPLAQGRRPMAPCTTTVTTLGFASTTSTWIGFGVSSSSDRCKNQGRNGYCQQCEAVFAACCSRIAPAIWRSERLRPLAHSEWQFV